MERARASDRLREGRERASRQGGEDDALRLARQRFPQGEEGPGRVPEVHEDVADSGLEAGLGEALVDEEPAALRRAWWTRRTGRASRDDDSGSSPP